MIQYIIILYNIRKKYIISHDNTLSLQHFESLNKKNKSNTKHEYFPKTSKAKSPTTNKFFIATTTTFSFAALSIIEQKQMKAKKTRKHSKIIQRNLISQPPQQLLSAKIQPSSP